MTDRDTLPPSHELHEDDHEDMAEKFARLVRHAFDEKLAPVSATLRALQNDLAMVLGQVGSIQTRVGLLERRADQIEHRLDRLERGTE